MPVVDFLLKELPGLDVAALVRQHPHILGERRQAAGCRCHAWLNASKPAAEHQWQVLHVSAMLLQVRKRAATPIIAIHALRLPWRLWRLRHAA